MGQPPSILSVVQKASGDARVYMNPAPNTMVSYPCVVITPEKLDIKKADNSPYVTSRRYKITVMARDFKQADALARSIIANFATAASDRSYLNDYIHHEILNVYY